MSEFDRRTFIKGTAAVVAGLGLSSAVNGLLGGDKVKAASLPDKWDQDFDVVVVGAGTGALAAVVAHDLGLRSVILEKANKFGGTTAMSGGGMWIPNNYLMQQEGLEDNFEDALKYMRESTFGQSEEDTMRAYLTEAPRMLSYLRDNGMEFQYLMGGTGYMDYYAPVFEGWRKKGRIVMSAKGGGAALMEEVRVLAEKRGIPVYLETPATKLVVDDKGAVVGVYAKNANGQEIAIRARKGVLMAAGGFSHNETMVKHFLRGPVYYPSAAKTCTGDGIQMGMAVGADLRNMNEIFGWPVTEISIGNSKMGIPDSGPDRGAPGAIYVNRYGQRFCNEASNYDSITRNFYWWDNGTFDYRNIPAFIIVDSEHRSRYTLGRMKAGMEAPWMNRSDSLEELAGKLGIDADGLKATVETFNRFASEGKDPYFHRGENNFDLQTCGDHKRTDLKNPVLAPLTKPPFYGTMVYPGALTTAGGLRINTNGQVLRPTGEVISGLYAAGVNSGNVMGAGYPGGGGPVGSGMTFSYIAARHMAK